MNDSTFIFDEKRIAGRLLAENDPARPSLHHDRFVHAAVCFLIEATPGSPKPYKLVLMRRTRSRRDKHSGEISFPGGKRDPADISFTGTALRECQEELGVERETLNVLGSFRDFFTPRGFIITPIVCWMKEGVPLNPNPSEVAKVFKIPIDFFARKETYSERTFSLNGDEIAVGYYNYITPGGEEVVIWGATAHLITNYLSRVYDVEMMAPGRRRATISDFARVRSVDF